MKFLLALLILLPLPSAFAEPLTSHAGGLFQHCVSRPDKGFGPPRICYPNRSSSDVSPYGEVQLPTYRPGSTVLEVLKESVATLKACKNKNYHDFLSAHFSELAKDPDLSLSWASTVVFSKWKVIPHLEINMLPRKKGSKTRDDLVVVLPDPSDWCKNEQRILHGFQLVAAEFRALKRDAQLAQAMMEDRKAVYRYWLDPRGQCQVSAIQRPQAPAKLGEWPVSQAPLEPTAPSMDILGLSMPEHFDDEGDVRSNKQIESDLLAELKNQGVEVVGNGIRTKNRRFTFMEYVEFRQQALSELDVEFTALKVKKARGEISAGDEMNLAMAMSQRIENTKAHELGITAGALEKIDDLAGMRGFIVDPD